MIPLTTLRGYQPYRGGVRVAIIGLGAVGATVLTSIDPRHSVTAVVRGDHGRAIKARGISVTGALGAHKIKVHALAKLPLEKFDAVVVAVKAHEIFAAIQSSNLQQSTPIIVIANGVGAMAEARRAAPKNPIALGLALFGASATEFSCSSAVTSTTRCGPNCSSTSSTLCLPSPDSVFRKRSRTRGRVTSSPVRCAKPLGFTSQRTTVDSHALDRLVLYVLEFWRAVRGRGRFAFP
ncbi:MAG: hypothetical protein RJA31_1138 [Actinomycetota bacterium]